MDDIAKFMNREVNVLDLGNGLTLGRESVKGMDYMMIVHKDEVFLTWWSNPKKPATKKIPKHTGGKPSYVKLLLKEMQKHAELSVESAGLIQKVIPNIRWGDNLIIDVRSKKPLFINDLSEIIKKSKPVTLKIVKELMSAGLLIKDNDGYKISPTLIQKGGGKN